MISIIKSTLKIILRNKVFWFFLIIAPFVSTLILNNKQSYSAFYDKDRREIVELEDVHDTVVYNGGNGEYLVKVYDASDSKISEYVLNRLKDCGMFKICRYKDKKINIGTVNRLIDSNDYYDRLGTVLFLDNDFAANALSGNTKDAIKLYIMSDDKRGDLFKNELKNIFADMERAKKSASILDMELSEDSIISVLTHRDESIPKKEIVSYVGKNERELTQEQTSMKAQCGYAFAFMTLGFVFAGILVSHTAIREQKNRVFTRIKLTTTSEAEYFIAKFIVSALTSVMLTGVMAISMFALGTDSMGISRVKVLFMILLIGLIFSTLSLMLGVVSGNVMTANILAFLVWNVTALLSGLYFPLKDTTKAIKAASNIMPQKWFLEGAEMFFVNDNKVYIMLLCITVAYLIVIISVGSLGLKLVKEEV